MAKTAAARPKVTDPAKAKPILTDPLAVGAGASEGVAEIEEGGNEVDGEGDDGVGDGGELTLSEVGEVAGGVVVVADEDGEGASEGAAGGE